jgi:4-amino-4-deoxy-L-arabinose transferase-like glycosyltransferase
MSKTLARLPAAVWTCALIALLNGCAWSIITPPFQGKDEVDHFAYIAQLAEAGSLPGGPGRDEEYSPEESLVMEGIHYYAVRFVPYAPAISTTAEQRVLMHDVGAHLSLRGTGGAGIATAEPPLYYLLQTIPYALARGNMLTQLQLMRLVGAFFGALTALFSLLFLREALPRVPWAASVGGVCVALQPLLAFMSGSVNPESMMFAIAAAVFYCLARAFRRGLSPRLALALGLLIMIGFATKLNFIGFAVGVFAGLAVLAVREARSRGAGALVSPAIAAGVGIAPVALYALHNLSLHRAPFGIASGLIDQLLRSFSNELSYTWELYLPRLPGMTHYFAGMTTFKDVWLDRSVGLYGWMDTVFPAWVDNVALVPIGVIALLCGRELFVQRHALRARMAELVVYAFIVLGVLAMIGVSSYSSDVLQHEAGFGEPRYLLPLVPLLGAVVVLAVRGAGRWATVAGAAIVILFLGHDVFSQLQVIGRFYG